MRRKPIQSETACFCWINRLVIFFFFSPPSRHPRQLLSLPANGRRRNSGKISIRKKRLHAFSLNLYPLPSEPIYEANECMFVTDRNLTSWCSKSLLFLCSRTRRRKKKRHCIFFFFFGKEFLRHRSSLSERCNNESTILTLSVSFTSFQGDFFK